MKRKLVLRLFAAVMAAALVATSAPGAVITGLETVYAEETEDSTTITPTTISMKAAGKKYDSTVVGTYYQYIAVKQVSGATEPKADDAAWTETSDGKDSSGGKDNKWTGVVTTVENTSTVTFSNLDADSTYKIYKLSQTVADSSGEKSTTTGTPEYCTTLSTLAKYNLSSATIKLSKTSLEEGGSTAPTVSKILINNENVGAASTTDYNVTYKTKAGVAVEADNVDEWKAGEYVCVVTSTKNGILEGTAEASFTVSSKLQASDIVIKLGGKVIDDSTHPGEYNGLAPEITVDGSSQGFTVKYYKGTDTTGTPIDPDKAAEVIKNVGTYTIEVTGKGYPYKSGSETASFTINQAEISSEDATVTFTIENGTKGEDGVWTVPYTGEAIEPVYTVKIGDKTFEQGTDFTVSYTNDKESTSGKENISLGTVTPKITWANYDGDDIENDSLKFKIVSQDDVKLDADDITIAVGQTLNIGAKSNVKDAKIEYSLYDSVNKKDIESTDDVTRMVVLVEDSSNKQTGEVKLEEIPTTTGLQIKATIKATGKAGDAYVVTKDVVKYINLTFKKQTPYIKFEGKNVDTESNTLKVNKGVITDSSKLESALSAVLYYSTGKDEKGKDTEAENTGATLSYKVVDENLYKAESGKFTVEVSWTPVKSADLANYEPCTATIDVIVGDYKGSEGEKDDSTEEETPSETPTETPTTPSTDKNTTTTTTPAATTTTPVTTTTDTTPAATTAPTTVTTTNAEGKTVTVTTTPVTDSTGAVVGTTVQSEIADVAANTSATVTVTKDAAGTIQSAEAAVEKTVSSGNKVSLTGAVVKQLAEAAGTDDVKVTLKVKDASGKTKYTVKADADELTAGNKLKIYQLNTKTGEYVMVNAKTYTVNKNGTVSVSMTSNKTYELVTEKEAKAITKQIKATVKAAKSSASVKAGKTTTVKFSSKLNTKNVKSITYTSSKKSVATVNKNGKVTAKQAGTATIKAKVTLKDGTTKTVKMTIKVK